MPTAKEINVNIQEKSLVQIRQWVRISPNAGFFNLPAFDHQRIYCQINRKSGLGRRVTNPPGDSVGFACHDDLCGTLAV